MAAPTDEIGEQLTAWGKVARLETHGRSSGRQVVAAVGFIEEPDGSLLVAAGSPETAWGRNLDADPWCRVTVGPRTFDARAEAIDGPAAADAVVALILKYGTPAERLGRGPVFRLRPAPRGGPDPI